MPAGFFVSPTLLQHQKLPLVLRMSQKGPVQLLQILCQPPRGSAGTRGSRQTTEGNQKGVDTERTAAKVTSLLWD